jgi:hypothetical protein
MAVANPFVTFYLGDTFVTQVNFNATQPDSSYRYWIAACFDENMNVRVIN